jgi:hypothetical protein
VSCPKETFESVVPAAGVNVEMITDAISFIYQISSIFLLTCPLYWMII